MTEGKKPDPTEGSDPPSSERSSTSRSDRGRDLNQSLLPDSHSNKGLADVMSNISGRDISIGSSARVALPKTDSSGSSQGSGSQTTPADPSHMLSAQAAHAMQRGPRVRVVAAQRCYGLVLDSKDSGPTCHGVYSVVYKLHHRSRARLPAWFFTEERIASWKTPLPYRGICVKRLKVKDRAYMPKNSGENPKELVVTNIDIQFKPDPATSVGMQRPQPRAVKAATPSLGESLTNTLHYAWAHPGKAAREANCFVRESATRFRREWGKRHASLQLSEKRNVAWRSVKQKWRSWRKNGRSPFQD